MATDGDTEDHDHEHAIKEAKKDLLDATLAIHQYHLDRLYQKKRKTPCSPIASSVGDSDTPPTPPLDPDEVELGILLAEAEVADIYVVFLQMEGAFPSPAFDRVNMNLMGKFNAAVEPPTKCRKLGP